MSSATVQARSQGAFWIGVALVMLALAGLPRLQFNADYRAYFDPDDPLLALESAIGRDFSLGDSVVLVLDTGSAWTQGDDPLQGYRQLERSLRALPQVSEIRGFHHFVEYSADILGDDGEDLFAVSTSGEGKTRQGALERLLDHPRGRDLVSIDGRFGLIEVRFDLPGEDPAREVSQAMSAVVLAVNQALVDNGTVVGVEYSGVLALNQAYIDVVRHDLAVFVPGLLLLMTAVLWLSLGNFRLALLPLVGGLSSALVTMGIAGWLHWPLAAINVFTPIIVVSLHLAAAMHLIFAYLQQRTAGSGRERARRESLAFNLQAMTLSALTTAGGFLLLLTSPSPPIRSVGLCVAVGVLVSYGINRFVLPHSLVRLDIDKQAAERIVQRWGGVQLALWLPQHRRAILILTFLLSVAALFSLGRAEVNDSVYDYFPADHTFSRGNAHIDQHFDGCIRLSYVLSAPAGETVWTPAFVRAQREFVAWLEAQPEVGGVRELYGMLARQGWGVEQAAFLLDGRKPAALGLETGLSLNLDASRVEVYLKAMGSRELILFNQRVQSWLSQGDNGIDVSGGSGPDLVFAWLGQRNATSMFLSLGIAIVAIGLLVGLLFRTPSLAILGLACNLLPLLLVYAAWFAAGGYISLGAAVVMGMIMGIIVDDTLHMLCKYRRLVQSGEPEPVAELCRRVLPAVLVTSVTLALGLAIGLWSDFRPLRELSLLSAGIIVVALLVDALVLPAALFARRIVLRC